MLNRYKSITKALLVTLAKFLQSVTNYNLLFYICTCYIGTYKISLNFVTFCNGWSVTIKSIDYKQLTMICNVVTPVTLSSIFLLTILTNKRSNYISFSSVY